MKLFYLRFKKDGYNLLGYKPEFKLTYYNATLNQTKCYYKTNSTDLIT